MASGLAGGARSITLHVLWLMLAAGCATGVDLDQDARPLSHWHADAGRAAVVDGATVPVTPVVVVSTAPPSALVPAAASCMGAGCLAHADCPPGAPAASFVTQSPPAATLVVGTPAAVAVTFLNCSGSTWHAVAPDAALGIKLGADAPQNNTTWRPSRVALPADVPTATAVSIPFTVTAPASTGTYAFAWSLLDERVGWLSAAPAVSVAVVAAPGTATVCPGVPPIDQTGTVGVAAALQHCIDATPAGGTLELPAVAYRIDGQLTIDHPMTLRTAGVPDAAAGCYGEGVACAVLQADADLLVTNGFLVLGATTGVRLDHIVLDGHRSARHTSAAAAQCALGNNRAGFNAHNGGCTGCALTHFVSMNALCGTGFEWSGAGATITDSVFRDNGDHAVHNMWSDGLTLLEASHSTVAANQFTDNSDCGLVVGGAVGTTITGNHFDQTTQVAFAALNLDNFNGGTTGDFTGAMVTANHVDCGLGLCDFGINIGPHPWYHSANLLGGTVRANGVVGARQGLNVDGGGTAAAPVHVSGNSVIGSQAHAAFDVCPGGRPAGSNVNISPDAHVNRDGETAPVTTAVWHDCH